MKIGELLNPANIVAQTAALAERIAPKPSEPEDPAAARLQNIANVIAKGDFGCKRSEVKALVEAMEGPLPNPRRDTSNRIDFTGMEGALVWASNDEVDTKVGLITNIDLDGDATLLLADGDLYTYAYANQTRQNKTRPATDEEIATFFDEAGLQPASAQPVPAGRP